jgi:hypothetical protein
MVRFDEGEQCDLGDQPAPAEPDDRQVASSDQLVGEGP